MRYQCWLGSSFVVAEMSSWNWWRSFLLGFAPAPLPDNSPEVSINGSCGDYFTHSCDLFQELLCWLIKIFIIGTTPIQNLASCFSVRLISKFPSEFAFADWRFFWQVESLVMYARPDCLLHFLLPFIFFYTAIISYVGDHSRTFSKLVPCAIIQPPPVCSLLFCTNYC